MRNLFLLVFIVSGTFTYGQSLKTEIDQVYNFKPSKLSKAEQQAKFPVMDKLFAKIQSDTAKYLPELRGELIAAGHAPYFYYDGCALLLTLSKSFSDKKLIAKEIAKADIADLNPEQYTRLLNQLANEGADVTVAAMKILEDDKYSFFLPQHAFTFTQGYALTYTLLPQNNTDYVDKLIDAFKRSGPTAQRSIIMTLWFAYNCKGDALISAAINDQSVKKEVRDFAKDAMEHGKLLKQEAEYSKNLSKDDLEELRTKALQRFSDEAVGELDLTTKVLRSNGGCSQ